MRLFFALTCVLFWSVSAGAAPTLTQLFPAGGQRGTTVEVVAGGTFDKWPVQVWVSAKGVAATAAKEKGKLSVVIAADAVPTTYWLRAYDDTGASSLRPFVVGTLPEISEKEPNDDAASPQQIASSSVVNGKLAKSGDVDSYAVALKKGQTLVASLEAHHTLRSPMDSVLQVVSPEGFVLDQDHDFHGLDPQLAFTAPAEGTYVVRAFAFPATPDSSIRFSGADGYVYRLTLTTGGYADFVLPLAISARSPGNVRLEGWNLPATAKSLKPSPTNGRDFTSITSDGVANAVVVRVEAHDTIDATTSAPTMPLSLPTTVTARLAKPGDVGSLAVAGISGKPITVQVKSRTWDLPLTPVLRVLDAGGNSVARAEPAALDGDCEATFTPSANGTYRVEIRDLYSAGGPRYVYCVRLTPAEPDFDLTVTADKFTISPDKPLEVPVTVTPRNGFKGDVMLAAENLPTGVTVESKPASGKTVTVKLSSTKPGTSGMFRITGRAARGGPIKVATAKLTEFNTDTQDLWLTVASDGKKK